MIDWFDERYTPRAQQEEALEQLAAAWSSYDVFVIDAPVACGKSLLADAIAKYSGAATIATPTNSLLSQYRRDLVGYTTPPSRGGAKREDWVRTKLAYQAAKLRCCNYYHILALKAYSPTMIFDECHVLIQMLQDSQGVTLWRHLDPWPDGLRTAQDLLVWAAQYPNDPKLPKLVELLSNAAHGDYTVSRGWAEYRGTEREYLRVHPLSARDAKPLMWPSRVKKLVLMSATFSAEDVYDLGLDTRRVKYIKVGSPIPAARRPVVLDFAWNGGYRTADAELPYLVQYLEELLDRHQDRGVVHTTYQLARALRETQLGSHPRLTWHGADNATSTYNNWLRDKSTPGRVLVACGMDTGLDLKESLARWQVITKVQYLSLQDPAISAKMNYRPAWYQWAAVKHILQATGRVCRTPTDYGVTYIADLQFARLLRANRHMFPPWFLESLV